MITTHGEIRAHRVTSSGKRYKPNMKIILFFTCVITLLTTTGCLVSDAEWHGYTGGHDPIRGRSEVKAGPPAVVVRAPEVVVRPPDVIVR